MSGKAIIFKIAGTSRWQLFWWNRSRERVKKHPESVTMSWRLAWSIRWQHMWLSYGCRSKQGYSNTLEGKGKTNKKLWPFLVFSFDPWNTSGCCHVWGMFWVLVFMIMTLYSMAILCTQDADEDLQKIKDMAPKRLFSVFLPWNHCRLTLQVDDIIRFFLQENMYLPIKEPMIVYKWKKTKK